MNIIKTNSYSTSSSLIKSAINKLKSSDTKIILIATAVFSCLLTIVYLANRYGVKTIAFSKSKQNTHSPIPSTSFSGFTKIFIPVETISRSSHHDDIVFGLSFSAQWKHKIQRRQNKFSNSLILSINGVQPAEIDLSNKPQNPADQSQLFVKIHQKELLNSNLKDIHPGHAVAIGMASSNRDKRLLSGKPQGTVVLNKIFVPEANLQKKEMIFECSQKQYEKIKNCQYVGLNGASFYIQKTEQSNGRYFFRLDVNKNKLEFVHLEHNSIGTKYTLTLPFLP